jgi:hypothetical protein
VFRSVLKAAVTTEALGAAWAGLTMEMDRAIAIEANRVFLITRWYLLGLTDSPATLG